MLRALLPSLLLLALAACASTPRAPVPPQRPPTLARLRAAVEEALTSLRPAVPFTLEEAQGDGGAPSVIVQFATQGPGAYQFLGVAVLPEACRNGALPPAPAAAPGSGPAQARHCAGPHEVNVMAAEALGAQDVAHGVAPDALARSVAEVLGRGR